MSIAPVATTTSITFSSNRIQNGDILVPTNLGPPRKMADKMERAVLLLNNSIFTVEFSVMEVSCCILLNGPKMCDGCVKIW